MKGSILLLDERQIHASVMSVVKVSHKYFCWFLAKKDCCDSNLSNYLLSFPRFWT